MIAHQLSTLDKADYVIMLNHGRVDQHRELASPSVDSPKGINLSVIAPTNLPQSLLFTNETQKRDVVPLIKLSPIVRLFKLLSPFWVRILLSILLGFATIITGIGLMATSAYIISAAALYPSIADLQVAIIGVRFFGLSRGVFRYLERLVSHDVTFRLLAGWRVWFYQAVEPLVPARLIRHHSGDLLTRVIRDIGSLENFYIRMVNPPLVALLVSVAVILFLAGFGTPLAWVLLFFLLLAGIVLPILIFLQSHRVGPHIITARAQYSTLLIDSIQGMPDLLTCGQAQSMLERLSLAGEQVTKLQNRMAGIASQSTALGNFLANLGMLSVLAMAIQMVSTGQLEGVLLGVVTLTALTCFEATQPLPQVTQTFESIQAAAGRLYELVDTTRPVSDPIQSYELTANLDLEVKNLSFQYPPWPDSDLPVSASTFGLKDISFSLPQGKHITLVGASGAGKTTLINLLLRFWDYQQGSILLGGLDLRSYKQDEIRRLTAIISQNTYLFSATIKENLLIAKPQATDDEIKQVSKKAQLYRFIQSLPSGYDTWIGEQGLRLSAGERQRLALARALLKDSPLLILDEPFVNLDPATQLDLINTIRLFSVGKTTITVTQDLIGLESMDEILVLQKGSIIERGTHDQLLACRGVYSRMWNLYHQIV